jgi:hypothetical protein
MRTKIADSSKQLRRPVGFAEDWLERESGCRVGLSSKAGGGGDDWAIGVWTHAHDDARR